MRPPAELAIAYRPVRYAELRQAVAPADLRTGPARALESGLAPPAGASCAGAVASGRRRVMRPRVAPTSARARHALADPGANAGAGAEKRIPLCAISIFQAFLQTNRWLLLLFLQTNEFPKTNRSAVLVVLPGYLSYGK